MSESVRIDLRQATLSESAPLSETGEEGQAFIALDSPPPVRSLLKVTLGEDQRAFEVGRVVEVVDEDEPKRGCYGIFVELERLAEQDEVGSEHLEPAGGGGAVPAPVVIMNTADMELGEAGDEAAEAAAAAAAGEGEAEGEGDSDDSDEGDSDEGDSDDSDEGDSDEGDSDDSDEGDSDDSDEGDSDEGESNSDDSDEGDSDDSDADDESEPED